MRAQHPAVPTPLMPPTINFNRRPVAPAHAGSVGQMLSPSDQHLLASAREWQDENAALRKKVAQLQQHAAEQGVAAAGARALVGGSRRELDGVIKLERLRRENDELMKRNAKLSEQVRRATRTPSSALRCADSIGARAPPPTPRS